MLFPFTYVLYNLQSRNRIRYKLYHIPFLLWLCKSLRRCFASLSKATSQRFLKNDYVSASKEWGTKGSEFTTSGTLGYLRRNTFVDFCQRGIAEKNQ